MTSFKIKVDVKDALDKLKNLDIHQIMKEELHDGGDQIMDDAKEAVHVITGDLKASGSVRKTDREVHGGFTKDYATIEENRTGGKYSGSHAYLEPAVDKNGPVIHKNMERRIKEAIRD
jgi:hypothetical protein